MNNNRVIYVFKGLKIVFKEKDLDYTVFYIKVVLMDKF